MGDDSKMQGPFQFVVGSCAERWWDIADVNGVSIASVTACLIDGSGGHNESSGYIRTREQRQIEAQWVLDALNAAWEKQ